MFNKLKVRKYIQSIQLVFCSDEFTDLFIDSDILGFSDSEFTEDTFFKLSKIFEDVYNEINKNTEFSKLILDGSDYLIPYTLGWIKLHTQGNKIIGITLYFNKRAYKLYTNNNYKKAYLNVLDIEKPRNASVIENNLRYV